MKISRLFAIALPFALLISSCDREASTEPSTSSDQVVVLPRLMAASPLPGVRIELRLQRKGLADIVIDTLYASGRTLRLGSVTNGDSFAVRARGYDSIGGGRKYLWSGFMQSLAKGGRDAIQLVDVPIDTVPSPPSNIDIAGDPTAVLVPKGSWYTTDSSDPRTMRSGTVRQSDSVVVAKLGTIRLATMEITSGDTLWSPVVTLIFGTSKTRDSLEGIWWEDDTASGNRRLIYRDSLDTDGTITRVAHDTITLQPMVGSAAQKGTWRARDSLMRWSFEGDTTAWSVVLRRLGNGYKTEFVNRALKGVMTRSKPTPSKEADTTKADTTKIDTTIKADTTLSNLRDSLVGVWWEVDTTRSGRRVIYRDSLDSNGTFQRLRLDTIRLVPFPTTYSLEKGTWSLEGDTLLFELENSGGTYTIFVANRGDHIHLDWGEDDQKGRLTKTKPVAPRVTNPVKFSLLGTWKVVDLNYLGNYQYFKYVITETSLTWEEYEDSALTRRGTYSGTMTWSTPDSITFVYKSPTSDPDTSDMRALDSGFVLDHGRSTETLHRIGNAPVSPLVGIWWEDYRRYDGSRFVYSDTIKADGTFSARLLDTTSLELVGDVFKGTWVLANGTLTLRNSGGDSDIIAITAANDSFKLAYHDSSKGTLSKVRPKFGPSTGSSFVGSWWMDFKSAASERWVYSFDLKADSTFGVKVYDTLDVSSIWDSTTGTWSVSNDTFQYTFKGETPVKPTFQSIAAGYQLTYPSGSSSTLSKTKPTPSTTGSTDTTWNSASRTNLEGTWWYETTSVTSSNDTVSVVIRHVLSANGSGKRTVFVTWLDSISDTSIAFDATSEIIKVMTEDSTSVGKYTKSGDTLRFVDGSISFWSKARPVLCDPTMVGTWMSATDSLIINASSKADWYWTSSRTLYPYTWSTKAGKIFFYQKDEAEPTYRYVYTPGSTSAILYEGDEYTKMP